MKTLFTLIAISICSITFGQPSITVTDDIQLERLGLLKKIPLSKGELKTIQQHEIDLKQTEEMLKRFKQRDSVYQNMFIYNTVSPHIDKGDTLESWNFKDEELHLKFKPKKK